MLLHGVWGRLEANSEARLKVATVTLRAALIHWYGQEQRAGRSHTRIDFISTEMIGTVTNPTLKLKAMEGFGFAQFLVYCLETYAAPDAKNILLAEQLLVKLVETMKAAPARLTLPMRLELMDTWKQHMAVLRYLDIYLPKASPYVSPHTQVRLTRQPVERCHAYRREP